jgi:hypothetical protein
MGRPNEVKSEFAHLLRECLKQRYGRVVPAAFLALEFNLRARDCEPITQEAARRWLNGISMPEERKLRLLVSWLNIDLSHCFANPKSSESNNHSAIGYNNSQDYEAYKWITKIRELSAPDQKLIKILIKKLHASAIRSGSLNCIFSIIIF